MLNTNMLLLRNNSLVLTIPLASTYLSTILIYRFAFLVFLFSAYFTEILGGLFQPTSLSQIAELLNSFWPYYLFPLYHIDTFESLNTFILLACPVPIKVSNVYYKHNIKYFSSASNKEEFKNYWLNIKPLSEWYNLDKDGYSNEYFNKFKDQKGIYIYRLIQEPWKCYIGSAEFLPKRLLSHRWAFISFINTGISSVPLFYNAIKKHGWQSFEIAVLEIVPLEELANRENYYLNSKPYYNLKYFIDGKVQHSDEVRAQISISVLGEDNPFFGKTHNEMSKLNMSTTKFLSKNNEFGGQNYLDLLAISKKSSLSKTIYQISKDKKEIINSFPSLNVTATYFKTNKNTIRKYLDTNTLFGNQWYLTTNLNKDPVQQIYIIENLNKFTSIFTSVYQYLINKENLKLINTFPSIATAAQHFQVTPMTIRRYLKDKKIFKNQYLLSKDSSLDNSNNNS
jgi:group I intron endonuclease